MIDPITQTAEQLEVELAFSGLSANQWAEDKGLLPTDVSDVRNYKHISDERLNLVRTALGLDPIDERVLVRINPVRQVVTAADGCGPQRASRFEVSAAAWEIIVWRKMAKDQGMTLPELTRELLNIELDRRYR